MLIGRTDRGLIASWWFTIDRTFLAGVLALIALGLVLNMAASPAVAERLGLEPFHFLQRQLLFLVPALAVLVAMTFVDSRQARRLCLVVFGLGLVLMALCLRFGPEIKGAHRWLAAGPLSIQPSEFVKPAFTVLAAWLIAEGVRNRRFPGGLYATLLLAGVVALLALQPDYGQIILLCAVWAVMLFLTGISWWWIVCLGVSGAAAAIKAYQHVPHFASRIDRFLHPDTGDTFQIDAALQAFGNGGLIGTGPGAGNVKRIIPDAHSDFIFAVMGEEFGLLVCLAALALFGFVVVRGLRYALAESDPFRALATAGLVSMVGFQVIINTAVNVALMPAKGMTLPFVSYGGSSLIALTFAMGLALAFTRRRPVVELPPGLGSASHGR